MNSPSCLPLVSLSGCSVFLFAVLIVSKTEVEETGPQTLVVGLALLLTTELAQKEEYGNIRTTPLK